MTVTINGTTGIETNTDTGKVKVGASDDLTIEHSDTGNLSSITHSGAGKFDIVSTGDDLNIKSSENVVLMTNDTEIGVYVIKNGTVKLYHDNTEQCSTSANGLAFPSGKGIAFSATGDSSGTTTSEILDEYEEGTWTGTIKYWDSSLGWHNAGFDTSPNNTTGLYTRIGRVVHVELYINGFDVNSTATGSYTAIAGLPFADATSDSHYGVISFAHDSCFATAAGGAYVESSMIRPTNVGTTTSSTWKSGGPLYVMLSGTYEIN